MHSSDTTNSDNSLGIIKDHKTQIEKSGAKILDPQVVSDAVVKQILSCRGDQIILAPNPTLTSTLRSWPAWLSEIVTRGLERNVQL